jgi:hypothetical protein
MTNIKRNKFKIYGKIQYKIITIKDLLHIQSYIFDLLIYLYFINYYFL